MRPYGTSEPLQKRQQKALGLLKRGKSVEQVADQVGVTRCSVYRWHQAENQPRLKGERLPGKPAYVSKAQLKQLEQELLRGAYAHGYSGDYWTLDRIGHVIWTLFKIRYTSSGVWRLLDRMNWSCQKIQRLAIQRHDDTITNWNRRVWPRIKKVAGPEG